MVLAVRRHRVFICWGMEVPAMRRAKRDRAKKSSPKHNSSLPDLDQARSAVLSSLPSQESQRGYRHAIDEFITWYCSEAA